MQIVIGKVKSSLNGCHRFQLSSIIYIYIYVCVCVCVCGWVQVTPSVTLSNVTPPNIF